MSALAVVGAAQAPSETTGSGVYSEEQAQTGSSLYRDVCARCHGPALAGSDMVPALTGPKFATDWNGATLAELYDRIRMSMPADMPATLESDDALAAVAFILRANGAPAGPRPLSKDPATLKNIRIVDLKR